MADLTDKREALARAVGLGSMTAYRACLARVVSIDFDHRTARSRRFIANHAMQFSKSPFGAGDVGFTLLLTCLFALPLLGSFADAGQVFQPDQAVGETGHDACGNDMIGVKRAFSYHVVFARVQRVLLRRGEYSLAQPIQLALS